MLFMPIIIKFYLDFGLTMTEIISLQAIYSISMLLFEIPSGYSADVFGRKKTIIIGTVCGFTGFLTYFISGSLWHFIIAEIIMGIGQSMISGADSAMLYDSLYEIRKHGEYTKYEGKVTASGNFAEALAGIIGGSLAFWLTQHFPGKGLQSIFLLQAIVAFFGLPAAILLKEPQRHTPGKKGAFKNIIQISKSALWVNVQLRYFIFFSALIGSATLTMAWFVQRLFAQMGIENEKHLGYLWALLNISVGIFTLFAHRVEKKLGYIKTMLLISVFIGLGYMSLWFDTGYYALIIILIFYFTRGIATPVLKDYINKITNAEVRATILSLRSFIIRIMFSTLGPIIAWLSDKNINNAMLFAGIFYLTTSLFLLFKVYQNHKDSLRPS